MIYQNLCTCLGDGIFSVANVFSRWAKDLPKSAGNKRRLAVINSMKRRGITNAAIGLHYTAEAELESLWNSIRISIDKEIDRELSRMRNPDGRITAQLCINPSYIHLANYYL